MKTLVTDIPTTTDTFKTPNNKQRTSSYQWRKLRQTIIERDKYTCQSCGIIGTAVDVDHIDANNQNNDPSNLQTLCRPCHLEKTTKENKGYINYLDHAAELSKYIKMKQPSKYDK